LPAHCAQTVPPLPQRSGAAFAKAREAFDALGTLLTDAVEPFRKKVRDVAESADELEVRMDLALKGEGKWVVVSVGGSASVSVRLVWKRNQ
jgi:NTP-dependent ternary system trypsin peptidase co-occuring protein